LGLARWQWCNAALVIEAASARTKKIKAEPGSAAAHHPFILFTAKKRDWLGSLGLCEGKHRAELD